MNIVKFNELRNLQDEMNRLFNLSSPRFENREEIVRGAWSPSVDIIEGKDEIAIETELAGMKIEEVDVSIENNVITISGERKFEKTDETDNYHRIERSYGTFTRSFTLPRNVISEEANAQFKNGILRITLPKREEAKARKIEIKGEPMAVKQAKA